MLIPPISEKDPIGEQEKHWKRQEHITPYRPSGKWRLFWWRVNKRRKLLGEKTGFKDKTLWDFLKLALLPLMIAIMPVWFNYRQSDLQKEIEADKYRQTALDNYITEMTKIIVDRDLTGVFNPTKSSNRQTALDNSITEMKKIMIDREIAGVFIFSPTKSSTGEPQIAAQNSSDNKEQKQTEQEQTKKGYLANIAKAKTLTTLLLLDLDPQKRNIVLDFLRTEELCCNSSSEDKTGLNKPNLLAGIRLDNSDLSKSDLRSFNLNGIQLRYANLHEAHLEGAKLTNLSKQGLSQQATLERANLTGAVLNGADLTGAILAYANLQDSSLLGAKLIGAQLQQANLQGADLSEAPQENDQPQRTDLSGAHLQGANLQNANLQNAKLKGADLAGANLTRANLKGADLSEATLDKADGKADLSGANLQDAEGGDTSRAKLCNTTMQDGDVQYRDCWFNIFQHFNRFRKSFLKF